MVLNDDVPPRAWRWLGGFAVILLLVAIGGISLISAGAFDPDINGTLQSKVELTAQYVPAQSKTLEWLNIPAPDEDYSLRLRARPSEGDLDIGYGLAVGSDEHYALIALSSLGYLTVRDVSSTGDVDSGGRTGQLSEEPSLPWQRWPHIQTGEQSNEIWLNVNEGAISGVRINRELLQTQAIPLQGNRIGLWVESFGESTAIEFQELELFH